VSVPDPRLQVLTHRMIRLERDLNATADGFRTAADRLQQIHGNPGETPFVELLAPLGAWLIDFAILSPSAEFLLGFLLQSSPPPWMVVFAKLAVPFVIVLAEVTLSCAADHAVRHALPGTAPWTAALPWRLAGVLVGVGLPLMAALALYSAARVVDPDTAQTVLLKAFGFATVSATLHLATVFRGHLAVQALQAAVNRGRAAWWATRQAGYRRRMRETWPEYAMLLQEYHRSTGDQWGHCLAVSTVQVVEEVFGRRVLPDEARPVAVGGTSDPALGEEVVE
jgi:hypothetical protein